MSAIWVARWAHIHASPDAYDRRLDRVLMYLARYAHQDTNTTLNTPTRQLTAWCEQISDILHEENEPTPR